MEAGPNYIYDLTGIVELRTYLLFLSIINCRRMVIFKETRIFNLKVRVQFVINVFTFTPRNLYG